MDILGLTKFQRMQTVACKCSFRVSTSTDGEAGILDFDVIFLEEVLREQLRIKITIPIDENDKNFSQVVLSTRIEFCKSVNGVFTTIFSRIVMENCYNSLNNNLTCPYPQNSHFKLRNCRITDKYLPPIAKEKQFKVEGNIFGMIKGRKVWKIIYKYEIYGRVKK